MKLSSHSEFLGARRGQSATAITKPPGSPPRSSVGCLLRQIFRHPVAQCCSNTSPRKRAGCTEGPNANGKSSASHHEGQKMKRLVPIIGLGLGAMASAAIPMAAVAALLLLVFGAA